MLLQRSDLGDAESKSPETLATFCQAVCTVYSKTVCVYVLHDHAQRSLLFTHVRNLEYVSYIYICVCEYVYIYLFIYLCILFVHLSSFIYLFVNMILDC